jgi:sulfoquinovosyltransferase
MVFAVILYAKLLAIPLVVSHHSHAPRHAERSSWPALAAPAWALARFCCRMADLTLVTSPAMQVHGWPATRTRCNKGVRRCWA